MLQAPVKIFVSALVTFSIAVKQQHDQDNLQKRVFDLRLDLLEGGSGLTHTHGFVALAERLHVEQQPQRRERLTRKGLAF